VLVKWACGVDHRYEWKTLGGTLVAARYRRMEEASRGTGISGGEISKRSGCVAGRRVVEEEYRILSIREFFYGVTTHSGLGPPHYEGFTTTVRQTHHTR
jgi:hypothetical protein